jgi:ABC-type branched-subunit amino acid transport system ATPase component/branched-subunit amino acid ABC-type transport system permease component
VNDLLPFIVIGLTTGSVYGLAATGLVLTYRTSGIFNFAHGAVAAAAAYVFYWLTVDHGMPWGAAFVISVLGLGAAAGTLLELLARSVSRQRAGMQIVATIGVTLFVAGLATIKYGSDSLSLPQYIPHGDETFSIAGTAVSYSQLTIVLVSLAAVATLYWLFRYSTVGVAMRSVVDDPDLVSLHGSSPTRIRRSAWMVGTTFAALSGVLIAPSIGIQAVTLTYLVVQAFGAAAVGRFSSIPLTYAGGLLLGIGSSVSTKYVLDVDWLSGLPSALPFVVLLVGLLVTPRDRLMTAVREMRRAPLGWRAPEPVRGLTAVMLVALLALVPSFAGTHLTFYLIGLSQGILILSLGLLVRTAGMVSLGHAAFAAIGAVSFSQFAAHIPWPLAVVAGCAVVVPVAALLALPAIRLSGLFLGLATFGFGLGVEQLFYSRNFMFTSIGAGREMPRPSWASSDNAFYYLVLGLFVFVGIVIEAIRRTRLGRTLQALGEAPQAATTLGLSANVTRVVVFCISGVIAGLGGVLYGATVHTASSSDSHYSSFYSLILLALLALSPVPDPWYAIVGVIAAVIPSYWTDANASNWLNVAFGVVAVQVAVAGSPSLPRAIRSALERWLPRRAPRTIAAMDVDTAMVETDGVLELEGVVVRYGGNVAVAEASLRAPAGKITALIGPNGAGKTSLFNATSGLVKPAAGRIVLNGQDVTRTGPAERARRGLGRTFQIMQLADSLSVLDNVVMGREAAQAGAGIGSQVFAPRGNRANGRAVATEALATCGIGHLAERQAGGLATGERRLVELARCLAGDFEILMLDEPSSGLSPTETERFSATLTDVVRGRGCGVLLVEHDMSLVMAISDYVYVLDFGHLIFEGTPAETVASSIVQNAYLGAALDDAPTDTPTPAGAELR